MNTLYSQLVERLAETIDRQRIITDPTLTLAYGTDASFYRLNPKLVLRLDNLAEVITSVRLCHEMQIPVTFRAAGTSLSGQAISDSVLITLTDSWREYTIHNQGEQVTLQPGIIGAEANRYLAPYGRKIGPDPASINTCKVGGIAANNASGMCCGTAQNSYNTLAGMTVVLADGTLLNTMDPESVAAFKQSHAELLDAIKALAFTTQADGELAELIRHKYRLKNTTGYSLNALVDYQDPIDVLQHLFIGSEGTLGFIADITYNTVIDYADKASGLFVFADIENTCLAVSELGKTRVASVELMDNRALKSVADKPGMPDFIATLDSDGYADAAALLVELHAEDAADLQQQISEITQLVGRFQPVHQVDFSTDPQVCGSLWAIRKGLFPAVGAVRETGTTVIIEDVAFPIERLAPATRELQQLFEQYGYHEAIIFGHALAGNLHFVFTQAFDSQEEVDRYGKFMDAVADLVAVRYQGSLKAEHGTGRNMAPYVEMEWGQAGYQLMQQIKQAFDPKGILNPGVILNSDAQSHLKDLKEMPAADELIDKCIECGFCEPVCASRRLTLPPRQRNTVYREISRLKRSGDDPARLAEIEQAFKYYGIDTCALDGLCAERCPVGINTGDLVRKLKTKQDPRSQRIASFTANQFAGLSRGLRFGLAATDGMHGLLGTENMRSLSNTASKLSKGKLPKWTPNMPTSAGSLPTPKITGIERQKVVYFPSCTARTMGPSRDAKDSRPLAEVTISLLEKAGYEVLLPENSEQLCCGMPYRSKGLPDTAKMKNDELKQALVQRAEQGRWPVLIDSSPCAAEYKDKIDQQLAIYEPFAFVAEFVLPKLKIRKQQQPVMLHLTCSSRKSGLAGVIEQVTRACAEQVVIPEDIDCCGFSGDKGFTTPELNASALAPLKSQIPAGCDEGYSNSRTCEIGLSEHSGIEYRSILYLVDKVSQA